MRTQEFQMCTPPKNRMLISIDSYPPFTEPPLKEIPRCRAPFDFRMLAGMK